MDKPNIFRRLRTTLTRIYVILLAALAIVSTSKWQNFEIVGSVFFLIGTILVGVATIGRIWCSMYISGYKSKTLITIGPYSLCRNPLYFFSMLGGVGVGLATKTLTIPLLVLIVFALYYPNVIQGEQKRLSGLHNDKFDEYCKKTPCFLPSFSNFKEPEEYVVNPVIFRKNIFDNLGFIWLVGVAELIQGLHQAHVLPSLWSLY
ncbi:MAG: isoprenylcysteine carboxylmethyltransferase family protein [Sedimentisphaerales bacterium]